MTEITIRVENNSILPSLRKILNSIEGVSIARSARKKHKSGLEEALDDVKNGRVYRAEGVDDLFQKILGEWESDPLYSQV